MILVSTYFYAGLAFAMAVLSIWGLVQAILDVQPSSSFCAIDDVKEEYKPGFLNEPERTKIIFKVSVPDFPFIPVTKFVAYRRLDNLTRNAVRARFDIDTVHRCRIIIGTHAIDSINDVRQCVPDEDRGYKTHCFRRTFKNRRLAGKAIMITVYIIFSLASLFLGIHLILIDLGVYGKHTKKTESDNDDDDDEEDNQNP